MFRKLTIITFLFLGLLGAFYPSTATSAQSDQPLVLVLEAEGALTPAMLSYIQRGLEIANNDSADIVILQLNTPGGSIDLMNQIVQKMRSSDIPIVVYVAPRGAMAGSAGTLITLAGHAAAMAPETAIGAASPVGSQGEDLGETIATKEKEILRATVRSLAANRPAEAIELAEAAIESAKAASAQEALDVGLIDFIAVDTDDLLASLNGFQVEVLNEKVTLNTVNAILRPVPLTMVEQALALLTNPNIVFLLLSIGVQAILIELSSPGGWVAGFVGIVCMALVIYSFGILPINLFGLIFIVLAFVLFVIDIKAPTHGALTAAGVASFIAGALILFNSVRAPGFPGVSVPLVIATGLLLALSFSVIISFAIRALRAPARMGKKAMIGHSGIVSKTIDPVGSVQFQGELWTAELAEPGESLPEGERVEVVAVDGLRLKVRKA